MYARVIKASGLPAQAEQMRQDLEQKALPAMRGQRGFTHGYWMADARSGRGLVVTIWEDEEALKASEEAATQMRNTMAGTYGFTVDAVETYEIYVQG